MTFSITVMCDQRLKFWNTIATCMRIRSTCARSTGSRRPPRPARSAMVSPATTTSPSSGISSRLMQRSSVDLPEPLAPRIEITSPSCASSEMPFSTSCAPKRLRRFRDADGGRIRRRGCHRAGSGTSAVRAGSRDCGDRRRSRSAIAARDREIEDQVDRAGADEDFDRAEGLGDDLGRDAGHFHQRDHARRAPWSASSG